MRLRQSNKKKQFRLPDYGLDLETPDAEDDSLLRADSSGDEFVAKVTDEGAVDEVQSDEDHSDHGDNEKGNDESDEPTRHRASAPNVAKTTKAKAKADAKTSTPLKQDGPFDEGQVFSEVPPYPSDPGQRWTRTYVGPIKRWTRFYELVDWWFSDKPDRRSILDGYLKLWWHHELIPPKLTTASHFITAQRGWMSEGFTDDQRSKFRQLYTNRLIHQFRQQSCIRLDKAEAFQQFIPQAQGELEVLLGPVSHQKPYPIQYGDSLSFSDSGQPIRDIEGGEIVTGGWLLDIGGITVSMAWAPTQGQVGQLLAIAVIPFCDQAYYKNLKDAPKESEQKEGTVQILRFEVSRDRRGILRPSQRAPQLAQALCFSWGRVSRRQWCPVQLAAEDPTRLLGVLCVDGKLRIIGIKNVSEKDTDEIFGKPHHREICSIMC